AMLAMFSLVLGVEPLPLLPYFCALIGSLSVIFIYALAMSLTKNEIAAFSAGIFAALSGLFVYVTTAAMKQLLAITLLCFLLFLYTRRRDWRFRAGMILVLVILPFTHHLASLIALLTFSFALVGTAFRRSEHHVRTTKEFILDAITGPGILLMSIVYYNSVSLEIASEVINANDIMLLASVSILVAVIARMLSITVQTRPWFFLKGKNKKVTFASIFDEKVLVLVLGIGVLYLNARVHLFTGAQLTSDALLRLMFPYFLLAIVGLMGFNVLRYSKFSQRHLVVGMFLAPLTIMVFSALRGLDLFGFMLAYRSYNFIDIPLAVVVGVGIAYIIGKLSMLSKQHDFFKPLPTFVMVIFIVTCAAALPLAYNSQDAFDVQEVTYDYELQAMEWASEHTDNVYTDQRCGDIMAPYFEITVGKNGPWKLRDGGFAAGDVLLASRDWTVEGAQMYPFGRVVFQEEAFDATMNNWNVCYVGGPQGSEMVVAIVR
ncbi:MAG: hypothetical protein KKD98_04260, partial [Candidatus Thermoplasmatota archaeon]|nr:hypothetical protein [Candidatus Thermoplasmatota archaeon]